MLFKNDKFLSVEDLKDKLSVADRDVLDSDMEDKNARKGINSMLKTLIRTTRSNASADIRKVWKVLVDKAAADGTPGALGSGDKKWTQGINPGLDKTSMPHPTLPCHAPPRVQQRMQCSLLLLEPSP